MYGGKEMSVEKWVFVAPEKAERTYKEHTLVVSAMSIPRRYIDEENGDYEDDIWKWFVYKDGVLLVKGYENTFDESTKVAEFKTREILNAKNK